MKSNIADKIKLFENAKIQHTAPLEFNPADSSQTKEEKISSSSYIENETQEKTYPN